MNDLLLALTVLICGCVCFAWTRRLLHNLARLSTGPMGQRGWFWLLVVVALPSAALLSLFLFAAGAVAVVYYFAALVVWGP